MRQIEIETDVFSAIWSNRLPGEENEDMILRRILIGDSPSGRSHSQESASKGKTLWRDDVRYALAQLGGEAHLDLIYKKVREIRLRAGRALPRSANAIVRRELEYNSSDSESYQRRFDWFRSVNGIGAGVWGLRPAI